MADPNPSSKELTKLKLGDTGKAVAANVKRLMTDQNMTYSALVSRLNELGRDIQSLGVRNIVNGKRRVDSDDLVALAVALGVSPATLLMPAGVDRKDVVQGTGTGEQRAERLWRWLVADNPLSGSSRSVVEFWVAAWPLWEHDNMAREVQERKRRITDRFIEKHDGDDQ